MSRRARTLKESWRLACEYSERGYGEETEQTEEEERRVKGVEKRWRGWRRRLWREGEDESMESDKLVSFLCLP